MAHIQVARPGNLAQPPRGAVILTLALLSWALFWAAGSVISGGVGFIAGI